MNTRKLNLITEATTAFPGVSINDAILLFLRNRYSSDQGLSDLIARYLYGTSAYNFDGIDDYGVLANRAINPDGDNVLEFWSPNASASAQTIISQNISDTGAAREFHLYVTAAGALEFIFGGQITTLLTTAQGYEPNKKFFVSLVGNTATIAKETESNVIRTLSFTRGAAREPAATTKIGARTSGAGVAILSGGIQRDIKINGTLWRMADRNQVIQLPEPSGLGAEIFSNATATVSGSVTASGNFFTFNVTAGEEGVIRTPSGSLTPNTNYLIELEVFDHVSGSIANNTNGFSTLGTSGGLFRQVFNSGTADRLTISRQGTVCNFKVRNISLKPLAVVNSTELVANGDFSAGTAGWLTTQGGLISVIGGQATLTTVAGQISRFERGVTLEANAYYEVSMQLISLSGNTAATLLLSRNAAGSYALIGGTQTAVLGRMSFIILAPATDALIQIRGDEFSTGTVVVDNVSIRKLDSLCNPMTLVNVTSDRWQEVPQCPLSNI